MSTARTTVRNAGTYIATVRDFQAGSLTGSHDASLAWGHRLPKTFIKAFEADRDAAREQGGTIYVVRSYATPIGWTLALPDGRVTFTVPDVRYSATTTRHQSLVLKAWDVARTPVPAAS